MEPGISSFLTSKVHAEFCFHTQSFQEADKNSSVDR